MGKIVHMLHQTGRLVFKMGFHLLRHPRQSVRLLSPRKIRHFFYFLKEEGPASVAGRIDGSIQGIRIQRAAYKVHKVADSQPFETYQVLHFRKTDHPKVSIIIPVCNQFAYTYYCLWSVLKNTGSAVSYEVIVADDGSTDATTRLEEVAENIRIIVNKHNLRFLKNCNHAAGQACGEYLVFLNNDTQVQKNWLQPLVSLLEQNEKAGIAGAKLVYADGRLQEAGGIIWNDGSAWNYGNGQDSEAPEFNYVKETDYISGAAMMIRTALWKEIGGFDERYAPAYYEDTDLACEVRRRGYQVLYQPLSVVVHFEGISNGRDVKQGLKAFQIENQKKFYEKWKKTLVNEQENNAEHVFLARERGAGRKILLVVDHYVPEYDKDAGSRCMMDYLKLFVSVGYHVKFIGDNFYKSEPYTTALQQMGIEVCYGDYYFHHWKDWISANGRYLDYVLLSRPHISCKYIDMIRTCSDAKIIYFGHDLHYLRKMREYRISGSRKDWKDSREWKKTEQKLMRKADLSYYLSQAELDEIKKEDPAINVRRVPIFIYDQLPECHFCASERKDILFVGGFGHPPNTDAVRWLGEEILPIVWKEDPDIILHVAGANPPKEIQALAGPRLIIHGFVSEEELEQMYRKAKLSVVPLRFGAGIKGKIIESMMWGVPVITTAIGIEGIDGTEKFVRVSRSAQALAADLLRLYRNEKKLEQMSREGRRYIARHYSAESAAAILEQDFVFDSSVRQGVRYGS